MKFSYSPLVFPPCARFSERHLSRSPHISTMKAIWSKIKSLGVNESAEVNELAEGFEKKLDLDFSSPLSRLSFFSFENTLNKPMVDWLDLKLKKSPVWQQETFKFFEAKNLFERASKSKQKQFKAS